VLFLSASKVLTTGSALTFDGTNFGVGGAAGNSTNYSTITARGATGGIYEFNSGATLQSYILGNSSELRLQTQSTQAITFVPNGSEQMRLTSAGNVGIGTSSPAQKLDVVGSMRIVQESTPSGAAALQLSVNGTNARTIRMTDTDTSGKTFDFINRAQGIAGNFGFFDDTAGAYRYIIDSSGNLGLGVTPSAWATLKGLQVLNANMAGLGNKAYFSANAFFSGSSWVYQASDFANLYIQQDGQHQWNTAPSGTAGDAISFSQVMTLDASGNLGIGATANLTAKLNFPSADSGEVINIYSNSNAAGRSGIGKYIGETRYYCGFGDVFTWVNGGPSGTERARIDSSGNFYVGGTTSAFGGTQQGVSAQSGSVITTLNGESGNSLGSTGTISNHPFTFKTNGLERARISSGGTLLVGLTDTSNYAKICTTSLGVYENNDASDGGVFIVKQSGPPTRLGSIRSYGADSGLAFWTNSGGTDYERARIDSSGNLLVGTTTAYGRVVGKGTGAASPGMVAICDTVSIEAIGVWSQATSGDNLLVNFGTEGTFTSRGSITYNRTAGLVAYNTTSDYRAKDIIGPVIDSGALIDSVPVYMGKMKGATQERPMFIAHEVPAYAHTGEKDAVDDDGKPVYQQMDASALIPVMWAEIQSLRARLAAANI
jgi:hypothetical protein